jgi:endo-1,4-beta-D-glucanase Y
LLPLLLLLMVCATGGCKQGPWTLWNAYETRFIDQQGRVFDPQGDQHSTSEGQAYALFFALAGNDRAQFDRVLNWTQANLARNDLTANLPSWLWGKDKDGAWKTLDANSASDADLWMAYTLVEAGRLWNAPLYTTLGKGMMARIAATEVADLPGFGLMLLPGETGFVHQTALTNQPQQPSLEAEAEPAQHQSGKHKNEPLPLPASQSAPAQTFMVNPSYLPPFLFARLASLDPAGPWRQIALNIPRCWSRAPATASQWTGWNTFPGDGFHPVPQQQPGNMDDRGAGRQLRRHPRLPVGGHDGSRARCAPVLEAVPGHERIPCQS